MKVIISILIILFVFLGCSTLPKEANGDSILVFPVQNATPGFNEYFVYYRFFYDNVDKYKSLKELSYLNEKELIVYPGRKYFIATNLTPGEYMIFARQAIYYETGKQRERQKSSIRFTLIPNTITVLNKAVEISIIKKKDHKTYQRYKIVDIWESDIEQIIEELKQDKNSASWAFHY